MKVDRNPQTYLILSMFDEVPPWSQCASSLSELKQASLAFVQAFMVQMITFLR